MFSWMFQNKLLTLQLLKSPKLNLSKHKNMEATVFNPIQLHLLQMFSRMNSEQELEEVQKVLSEYYFKKVAKRASELWDELDLDQQKLDEMANIHERLPYT